MTGRHLDFLSVRAKKRKMLIKLFELRLEGVHSRGSGARMNFGVGEGLRMTRKMFGTRLENY